MDGARLLWWCPGYVFKWRKHRSAAGGSGLLILSTGTTNAGNSGSLSIGSGKAGGTGGQISITVGNGDTGAGGAMLLSAGTKGKRYSLKNAEIMIHQPLGGAEGQASDIEITAREIQKLKKELYEIIAHHSGQTYEKVWADSDRDYWMIAQEAKEYGMIDEVLERK
ncbi:MAG: hypothetical protein EBU33_04255 [Sphingobacteriia bacterium]|nr:hypothetical protein [Sphingobacteriia bacterium]